MYDHLHPVLDDGDQVGIDQLAEELLPGLQVGEDDAVPARSVHLVQVPVLDEVVHRVPPGEHVVILAIVYRVPHF